MACAAVAIGVALLAGCGSDLKVTPEAYRGPALSPGTLDTSYLVIAQTPGAGWGVEIDATRKTADGTDVYLTMRRPNPVAAYALEPVEQRVLTRVTTDQPIRLLARVMDYASTEDRAYRRVR
jgi:hypothetical protein